MLYKFYPPKRIGFFKTLLVSFSKREMLNDEKEFRPGLTKNQMMARVTEVSTRNKKGIFKGLVRKGTPSPSKVLKSVLRKSERKLRKQIKRNRGGTMVAYQAAGAKGAGRNLGIFSLTKVKDSARMWREYAIEGTGFVIGFDERNEFLMPRKGDRSPCGILHEVRYSDDPVPFHFEQKHINVELLFTKMEKWAYEQEIRIIRELHLANVRQGNDLFLFRVPETAVKEILLGWNAGPELEEAAQAFAEKHPGVLLRRARQVGDDTIEFDDLPTQGTRP